MLIFDEAHNIEDVCREAASTEVELDTMLEVGAHVHGRQHRGLGYRRRGRWHRCTLTPAPPPQTPPYHRCWPAFTRHLS